MRRVPKSLLTALAAGLLVAWCSPAWAASERPTRGTVQSVNADQHQVVIKDKDSKSWTFHVMDKAAIFMPNQANAKLSDLKTGEDVSLLWQKKGDQFETPAILLHEGDFRNAGLSAGTIKNVSTDNNEFTATDAKGKQWTYHIADNAKFFRLGGTSAKLTDFRPNTHVALVWEKKGDQYRVLTMCEDPAHSSR